MSNRSRAVTSAMASGLVTSEMTASRSPAGLNLTFACADIGKAAEDRAHAATAIASVLRAVFCEPAHEEPVELGVVDDMAHLGERRGHGVSLLRFLRVYRHAVFVQTLGAPAAHFLAAAAPDVAVSVHRPATAERELGTDFVRLALAVAVLIVPQTAVRYIAAGDGDLAAFLEAIECSISPCSWMLSGRPPDISPSPSAPATRPHC